VTSLIQRDLERVAPAAPGLSTESDFLPWYSGEPSDNRAVVVPISSTWLISSVPTTLQPGEGDALEPCRPDHADAAVAEGQPPEEKAATDV